MAAHQAEPKSSMLSADGERQANSSQDATRDFLSKFLDKHSQNLSVFSTYHVEAGCVSNMVAGSDTTSFSLSVVLYYLLQHPPAMRKLREEVDAHYGTVALSNKTTF